MKVLCNPVESVSTPQLVSEQRFSLGWSRDPHFYSSSEANGGRGQKITSLTTLFSFYITFAIYFIKKVSSQASLLPR